MTKTPRMVKKLAGCFKIKDLRRCRLDEKLPGARLLAYVTGLVNQELLLQVEYLVAENRILRAHAPARLRLSNEQRSTLAEIGKRLGRKGLAKSRPDRQTRDDPQLVQETGSAEVRWLEVSLIPGPAED